MKKGKDRIGVSQRVRLEWLEQTANLILAGNDENAVNEALQELLKDKVSKGSRAKGCNRDKVISILRMVWLNRNSNLNGLRNDGLHFLSNTPASRTFREVSIIIQWGMMMAVYPFWASVAQHTGRLLRLQGSVAASQVQRRIREQYGERETVSRAARRVLRTFIDWGVLKETEARGVYAAGTPLTLEDSHLIAWIIEATLYSRECSAAPLKDILESPSLFPFRCMPVQAESLAIASSRLEFMRQGLDDSMVMLRLCIPMPVQ